MAKYILAIDQGTTSSRAMIIDENLNIVSSFQQEVANTFPHPGWVLMDGYEIWVSVEYVCIKAVEKARINIQDIAAIGITNQRETTIVWDKKTGLPVYDALVWQSRQSAGICEEISKKGYGPLIKETTGLTVDPYFSASKIRWILDNIEDGDERAKKGELLFGTVDSWLVYKLTKGKVHVTDVTNASRTMLMNLKTLDWDEKMLQIFNIDRSMLPKICDSSQIYGYTDLLGVQIPICSICGDQQSALFGQMCFEKGQCKNTYGTGCFLLFNAGNEPIYSKYDLITSVGWKIKDEVVYVLEGSVFVAGAAIQWLRDGLKVIDNAAQTETIAKSLSDSAGVYVVPAFTGLGAPYWSQNTRGAIFGLTRGTTTNHIIRATLESLAYQSYDVIEAMQKDTNTKITSLQVDGGASNNDYLMQFQADILQTEIARPSNFETTALGAAMLAGLSSGLFKDKKDLLSKKEIDKVYQPQLDKNTVNDLIEGWKKAINSVLMF
ncbi:MAG: glycerol kinase GlpK [Erysipelotrichaceae bacterium]|nr:glycerol kinase GlpK [Erysipelotrichaceae bacterium]